MKKKIILNLSTTDYGGAGTFSANFNKFLLAADYESYLVVRSNRNPHPNTIQYPDAKFEQPVGKLSRQLAKWQWSDADFEHDRYFYGLHERYSTVSARKILSLIPGTPEVIFVHWVPNFINSRVIHELHQITGARIIWLMTDNAPITGGCHFPWDCRNFETDCHDCPAILNPKKKYLAARNLAFKKKYQTADARICVFSQNDYERAEASALFGDKKIHKMPGYFVDERKFCPGDRTAAKAAFGIPPEQRVVFFGATSLTEKRKGMSVFVEAIQQVPPENTTILIAGSSELPLQLPNMLLVGNLDEAQLIKAYQASDMFVCPVLEDSGPTMLNQAIMCGTPVVSFEAGLGKDLVHTGKTGYRAILGDANDLAKGITLLLNQTAEEKATLSQNCRQLALDLYGGTESYKETVRDIIEN